MQSVDSPFRWCNVRLSFRSFALINLPSGQGSIRVLPSGVQVNAGETPSFSESSAVCSYSSIRSSFKG